MARIDSFTTPEPQQQGVIADDELRARRAAGFGGCAVLFLLACVFAVVVALFAAAQFLPDFPDDAFMSDGAIEESDVVPQPL